MRAHAQHEGANLVEFNRLGFEKRIRAKNRMHLIPFARRWYWFCNHIIQNPESKSGTNAAQLPSR